MAGLRLYVLWRRLVCRPSACRSADAWRHSAAPCRLLTGQQQQRPPWVRRTSRLSWWSVSPRTSCQWTLPRSGCSATARCAGGRTSPTPSAGSAGWRASAAGSGKEASPTAAQSKRSVTARAVQLIWEHPRRTRLFRAPHQVRHNEIEWESIK